jgi:hypothetical protein
MSDTLIYGKDCLTEILIESNWYPIMCQADMTFHLTQEVILKTTPNSGLFREKTTRFAEASASVSGYSPIENGETISIFYIIQESVRTKAQDIRLRFVDKAGASKQISGKAIIVDTEIGAPVGEWCSSSVDLQFTGAFSIEDVTDPPPGTIQIYSDTWNVTPGQNWIDGFGASNLLGYTIQGKTILEVDRSGIQYDFVGYSNSTPVGNRQVKYNSTTHRLEFEPGADFNAGETVFIIFKF